MNQSLACEQAEARSRFFPCRAVYVVLWPGPRAFEALPAPALPSALSLGADLVFVYFEGLRIATKGIV